MSLERRNRGHRLSAEKDWNPLIDEVNRKTRKYELDPRGVLQGICTEVAPVYSLFEIYDTASSIPDDEYPIVGVRKPTSDTPLALVTNGFFPTVAGSPSHVELLLRGVQYKFDVSTSDSGFVVGEACGPQSGSYQLSSEGSGLICLSDPIVYEGSKKLVWAAVTTSSTVAQGGIAYVIDSLDDGTGHYTGLKVATVTIKGVYFGASAQLIETQVEVVDHEGCIFDEEDMEGYSGWAGWAQYLSLDPTADCDDLTPHHWAAYNRCCAPNSGTYAEPCP